MRLQRIHLYEQIEAARQSKLLVYITGDRQGLETQIHPEVLDYFTHHLDTFGLPEKISLLIYSRGGSTLAGWSIANLVRQFCKKFEVIVPAKAHSTATLICLAADTIMMTKQATLGPIDPSVNGPLNPQIPGAPANARLPVSVEDVVGFLDLAKQEGGLKSEAALAAVFQKLADNVHPLALGSVNRARTQIQMLAKRSLELHMKDADAIKRVVAFVCSESGSHDYTIFRREAHEKLKLPIEKPSQEFYDKILRPIYLDIRDELKLNERFDPKLYLGADAQKAYTHKRCIIESISGGQHHFTTQGVIGRRNVQTPNGTTEMIENNVQGDTWKHEA